MGGISIQFGFGNSSGVSSMDAVEKELQGYTKKGGAATSNLSAMDFWLLTDAGYELSLQRMKEEADALGADAVVNVKVEIVHRSEDIMEVVATGTAVKRTGERSSRPVTLQVGN